MKILALDIGEKRIGIAVSDESATMAFPRGMVLRQDAQQELEKIIAHEKIAKLVIGLPLGEDNEETVLTERIRKFGDALAARHDLPVMYIDEFLSTREALSKIPSRKERRKKGKDDAMAAQVILERYISLAGAGFGHASRSP